MVTACLAAEAGGQSPRAEAAADVTTRRPTTRLIAPDGRVTRLFGDLGVHGETARQSADAFRHRYARTFGASAEHLEHTGLPDGQPVAYQPDTGTFRLTAHAYRQVVSGIPVFGTRLVVAVRNEPGHPVVLAAAELRDMTGLAPLPEDAAAQDFGAIERAVAHRYGSGARVVETERVIWAGAGHHAVDVPVLADRSVIAVDPAKWLLVTDARTHELLFQEPLIFFGAGSVTGLATDGAAAEHCEDEVPTPLPGARITLDDQVLFADATGIFALPFRITEGVPVTASLHGAWFAVTNAAGEDATASATLEPGHREPLLLNAGNDEESRAQVNAYLHASRARSKVLACNPLYPGLHSDPLPLIVNRTGAYCPGNAWYDADEPSLNFCLAGAGAPNTAWSSVVYHEFGHHLVQVAGSGQGAYGEGISDAISLVLLDLPEIALGLFGDCATPLRTADNDCQYDFTGCSTCGSSVHQCGQVLSGCMWSLRNLLAQLEPDTYRQTLATLVVNSILLHTGSSIDGNIVVDMLTVDDDNGDLLDGTPHQLPIVDAFAAHGLAVSPNVQVGFRFPQGLPEVSPPSGGAILPVELVGLNGAADVDSVVLHTDGGDPSGRFVGQALELVAPGTFVFRLPAVECLSTVRYFFSATTVNNDLSVIHTFPPGGSDTPLVAVAAAGYESLAHDDFEFDLGWTVTNTGGLQAGSWERGVPSGTGMLGDPTVDADGSGRCFLTGNDPSAPNDVDSGCTILTSPSLGQAFGGGATFLSYHRWFSNSTGPAPADDAMVIEISYDGGSHWSTLETVGPSGPAAIGGWYRCQFRGPELLEPSGDLRLRVTVSDEEPGSTVEAAIDGIEVRRYSCDPGEAVCSADVTGDGSVDVDDVLAILAAWGAPGSALDIDGSGTVDAGDLEQVLAQWGSCPSTAPQGAAAPSG